MALANAIGRVIVAAVPTVAPGAISGLLRRVIDIAVDGQSKFPGARVSAGKHLQKANGDVETAITALIRTHVGMAGAQGFVTNVGGIATLAASLPANLAGVAIVQSRMVAAVAHLRGYDLDDSRVRTAILMCLLGRTGVQDLIAKGDLPSTPMGIATAPALDQHLEQQVAERVLGGLMTVSGGKQMVSFLGKRIPVIGGGFGAAADGYTTMAVARYAREQFVNRRPARS